MAKKHEMLWLLGGGAVLLFLLSQGQSSQAGQGAGQGGGLFGGGGSPAPGGFGAGGGNYQPINYTPSQTAAQTYAA